MGITLLRTQGMVVPLCMLSVMSLAMSTGSLPAVDNSDARSTSWGVISRSMGVSFGALALAIEGAREFTVLLLD